MAGFFSVAAKQMAQNHWLRLMERTNELSSGRSFGAGVGVSKLRPILSFQSCRAVTVATRPFWMRQRRRSRAAFTQVVIQSLTSPCSRRASSGGRAARHQGGFLMSDVATGLANVFIAAPSKKGPHTHNWLWTWNNAGWQGNTFLQPQPLYTGPSLSISLERVVMNPNPLYPQALVDDGRLSAPPPASGTYTFAFTVTNYGPGDSTFNVQISTN
jgi:hypothetical protein